MFSFKSCSFAVYVCGKRWREEYTPAEGLSSFLDFSYFRLYRKEVFHKKINLHFFWVNIHLFSSYMSTVSDVQQAAGCISGIWCGLCGVAGYQRPRSKRVLQAPRGGTPATGISYQKQFLFYMQVINYLSNDYKDMDSQEIKENLVFFCNASCKWGFRYLELNYWFILGFCWSLNLKTSPSSQSTHFPLALIHLQAWQLCWFSLHGEVQGI